MNPRARLRSYLGGENERPLLALTGLNAVDELDTKTFQWIAPTIAAAFGLSVGDFGLIAVLVLVIAPIIAVPVGIYADRRARMPVALIGAGIWAVFSALTGLATSVAMLFVARIGSDFGKVVNLPVHASLISDYYSPDVRARALGLHAFANYAGTIVATLAGAGLAAAFGFRAPFLLFAVPTVLVLLYAATVKEPPRGVYEKVQESSPPLREVAPRLWTIRSLRFVWISQVWIFGSMLGATLLLPFLLDDEFGIGTFGLGVVGAIGAVCAAVATVFGSRVAQRQLNASPGQGMRWIAFVGVAIAGLLVAFAASPSVWIALPVVWAVIAAIGLVEPLFATVITLVAPPELRASAFALGGVFRLMGAVFAVIITQLADPWGTRWAMVVAALLFLRGVGHMFTAARFVDSDAARLDPDYVGVDRHLDGAGRSALLETRDLTVSYDKVQVLFGVDIRVAQGEIVALLGTNGAGKSTILNAVSGLVEPDGGNVWFDGRAVTGEPAERMAALGLVQAPGGRGIFPGLTVAENLRLGAFVLRRDKALINARMAEVLDVFPALGPLMDRKAGALSGGQRQMLTLAQAFLVKPKLLLIDELSLGLAPVVVQELLATVRRLNATGTTILLVEQSVNVALTLADRAYFLEKGTVRFEGATADLLGRDDLLRSVFFGTAPEPAPV